MEAVFREEATNVTGGWNLVGISTYFGRVFERTAWETAITLRVIAVRTFPYLYERESKVKKKKAAARNERETLPTLQRFEKRL